MALSATAARMLDSLPDYYRGEPIIERVLQAWADEIDRIDALLDRVKDGLVASLAGDDLRMLALWEALFGLPVEPAEASVAQRRAKVDAALRRLEAGSAAGYLDVLTAAMGSGAWELLRDTPDPLHDTLQLAYGEDTYQAGVVDAITAQMHPAHRELHTHSEEGFLLDRSQLDHDTL
jgi:uncharacterized protein YmfQ (DUF2313 family)